MVQHITITEVKAACRKAYDEGRLLAQNAEIGARCLYIGSGDYCCAIGVALTDETRKLLLEDDDLNKMGISFGNAFPLRNCFTWSEEEMVVLEDIQNAHDSWLFGSPVAKGEFLELIDVGEPT